ncbi:MAG: LLM class F420-dependent oxidoreductase [Acidimicrobiales bacterium]|nr:MAG: LLM class F420-dependent oxidoreductase [Acidimicrobiales bacterium]
MIPRLSLTLITFAADDPGDWVHLVERVQAADQAGLDRVALSDHVAFGENLEAYGDPKAGGTAGGRQPTGPDGHWLDPLATIAHLTAVTTNLRFSTNILIAALRRPAALAKTLSTIDVLSGGRIDLGVGVGWQREEYEACGLDYDDRGAQLDHTLEVLQTLWRDERASYESDRLSFDGIHQMPKPVQRGGIPIWVSGTVNKRSMRRLARFGSGWIPWGPDAADLPDGIARMRAAVEAEGRDPSDIEVVANLPMATDADGAVDLDATMANVPPLVEAGASDFRAMLRLANDAPDAQERIAEMVGVFRDAVGRDQ